MCLALLWADTYLEHNKIWPGLGGKVGEGKDKGKLAGRAEEDSQ